MDTTQAQARVLDVLGTARPDDMLAPLQDLLLEHLGAHDVQILLANYQLTALGPIGDPGAPDDSNERVVLGGNDHPAGHAFTHQHPVTTPAPGGGTSVCLPVGVRGERLGVLTLTVPQVPDQDDLSGLSSIADTLAYAVHAAAAQTDAMARARRSRRLTLAAELQWQLLPGRGCHGPEYQLAGHLEPAYRVQADNFDWSQNKDQLVLSVTDAAYHQAGTSLLPTLAVTALRNARRAGLPLADQAILAGQAVYAHHQGREHISTLLLGINLSTGHASAVLAGTPKLLIQRGTHVLQPQLRDQDPLGMFEDNDYTEEHLTLLAGDRVLMITDGVHATGSPARERFGDSALIDLLQHTRDQPVTTVLRAIIDGLYRHHDTTELDDDAVILILDWAGPHNPTPPTSSTQDHVALRAARRLHLITNDPPPASPPVRI